MKDEKDFEGIESKSTAADQSELKHRFLRPVDTANELRHLLWQEFKLSKLIGGWIPAISNYEQKVRLGRLAYVHNRNVKCLYDRITELPGKWKDRDWIPEPVDEAFERIFAAESEKCFFVSYLFVLKQMYTQYEELMSRLDRILNAPTVDQIKIIFIERQSTLDWVSEQVQFSETESAERAGKMAEWSRYIRQVWDVFELHGKEGAPDIEILWPTHIVKNALGPLPEKARLEAKFPKYANKKPIKSYDDPEMSVLYDSVKQMIYIYATEIFAGETLSTIYYYVDRIPMLPEHGR